MNSNNQYTFIATIWQHPSPVGGWHFVSLPKDLSANIRKTNNWQHEGWGRMKATAQIGKTVWSTAIWFDTKQGTYLLPLKSGIRKKELLSLNNEVQVTLFLSSN